MKDEVLKLALEALETELAVDMTNGAEVGEAAELMCEAITAIKQALAAQPAPVQEPVAYNKTEMNGFIQDLYEKKMQEGKHGHYETMFHCVHQAIAKVTPSAAQRQWVGLTNDEVNNFAAGCHLGNSVQGAIYKAEAKLKEKNDAAQPAVPDAIHHTDLSEHPQYIEGWNDCRAEMLKGMKP
jgi:hypothetical protein